ncbi:hypothetical protein ACIRN4_06265 [Pimelobacter simplex]|uniref:hypothetical protein n=1 Tax=Nocardioides simplex TaxID=2045 RepID=UPI0038002605
MAELTDTQWYALLAVLPERPEAAEGWEMALVRRTADRLVREHVTAALDEGRRATRIDHCAHCGDPVISFGGGHWAHYRGPGSLLNRCQHTVPYGKDATPTNDGIWEADR